MPAGGFFFVTRAAFLRAGGFPEDVFVSEELWFGRSLKRLGRLVVVREYVTTSARKFQAYSNRDLARLFLLAIRSPFRFIRDRASCGWWYERRDPAVSAPLNETTVMERRT